MEIGKKADKLENRIEQDFGDEVTDLAQAMDIQEKRFILNALNQNRWHKGKTAAVLKIDPKTLYAKINKCRIS